MFEINIYPIIGIVLGVDYFNDYNPEIDLMDESRRSLDIYLLLIGITISWYASTE